MMAQSLRNAALCLAIGVALLGCEKSPRPGTVKDEALEAGLKADKNGRVEKLGGSDDPYLRAMDRGLDEEAVHKALPFLSKEEAWKSYNRGRNNWVVWTGGNDRFWDYLANNSFGAFDLLKILSSHPSIRYCGNKKAEYEYAEEKYGDYARDSQYGYGKEKSAYAKDKSFPAPHPPGYLAYEDDECKGNDRQILRSFPREPLEVSRPCERAGLAAVGPQRLRLEER